jgi:DNA repair and recombination protein RAD52
MFDWKTVVALGDKLPRSAVKSRKQGGASVAYVDGHHVISAANRIFGYGMWRTEILGLDLVENVEITNSNGKSGWRVGYICRMRVTVRGSSQPVGEASYEDVGFGAGTDYNSLGGAMESASKEALTDAMKRCLRNLGNQFGLALYDKDQVDVMDAQFDIVDAQRRIIMHPSATADDMRDAFAAQTYDVLKDIYRRVVARAKAEVQGQG